MRLIDADAYIEKYECCGYLDEISVKRFNEITPTIHAVERKKGRWLRRDVSLYRCSECGRFSPSQENYCPSCGSYNGKEKQDD